MFRKQSGNIKSVLAGDRVHIYADMAELADALDSGSSDFTVIQVQVLLSAPHKNRKADTMPCGSLFLFGYKKSLIYRGL